MGTCQWKYIKKGSREKFTPDEIRKSNDTWLTTYGTMIRVFGQPRNSSKTIALDDIENIVASSLYFPESNNEQFQQLLDTIHEAISNNETITVVKSKDHPDNIVSVIKTGTDLEHFPNLLNRYLTTFQ